MWGACGGRQLSAVAHRSDGRLVPPCVQRMGQRRAEAVAEVPHCQYVRGVVCPHMQPARHSLEREQETSLDLCVEEGYCQGL